MNKFSHLIDLHTHILPGLDDGAQDLDESIAMAKQAIQENVSLVAATPHYLGGDVQLIYQGVDILKKELAASGLELQVVFGAEIYIDPQLLTMSKEEIPTYNNNGRYCLLEFPMLDLPDYVDHVIFSLQVKGITPIIAHPERYHRVFKDPSLVAGWIHNGCLIQVNSGSILGKLGTMAKHNAEILLKHQMVHLVASDAHSTGGRGFSLLDAAAELVASIGIDGARQLVQTNPGLVVAGDPVPIQPVVPYRRRKRFWLF